MLLTVVGCCQAFVLPQSRHYRHALVVDNKPTSCFSTCLYNNKYMIVDGGQSDDDFDSTRYQHLNSVYKRQFRGNSDDMSSSAYGVPGDNPLSAYMQVHDDDMNSVMDDYDDDDQWTSSVHMMGPPASLFAHQGDHFSSYNLDDHAFAPPGPPPLGMWLNNQDGTDQEQHDMFQDWSPSPVTKNNHQNNQIASFPSEPAVAMPSWIAEKAAAASTPAIHDNWRHDSSSDESSSWSSETSTTSRREPGPPPYGMFLKEKEQQQQQDDIFKDWSPPPPPPQQAWETPSTVTSPTGEHAETTGREPGPPPVGMFLKEKEQQQQQDDIFKDWTPPPQQEEARETPRSVAAAFGREPGPPPFGMFLNEKLQQLQQHDDIFKDWSPPKQPETVETPSTVAATADENADILKDETPPHEIKDLSSSSVEPTPLSSPFRSSSGPPPFGVFQQQEKAWADTFQNELAPWSTAKKENEKNEESAAPTNAVTPAEQVYEVNEPTEKHVTMHGPPPVGLLMQEASAFLTTRANGPTP